MPGPSPLQYGEYYHIFNRGTNGENIFAEERNYSFFLQLYAKYIEPIAFTYAYCLLKNHFHLMVQIKTPEQQEAYPAETLKVSETFKVLNPSQQFSNLFNAYAKAFNRTYNRSGSLFEHPFHRIRIDTDAHFVHLAAYIHQNPQRHGFVDDFRAWTFSSYRAIRSQRPTRVQRDAVLEWFDGLDGFLEYHSNVPNADRQPIASIVLEEL